MIAFVKGKVVATTQDAVILENHGIGYQIFTPDPKQYGLNHELLLYTYQYVREDAILLYGFKDRSVYELFLKLIGVKGLGCKSALNMLAIGQVNRIVEAIENGDLTYLKSCPGIGAKTAQQIVLDLKGKLVSAPSDMQLSDSSLNDAHDALIALGYKANEIKSALKEVSKQSYKNSDEAIRLALSYLLKRGVV